VQAESLAQLEILVNSSDLSNYNEGEATMNSRLDYIRERLRLLYVGITRARRELIITSNVGRKNNLIPAIPLQILFDRWEKHQINSINE
jgi:DNA helicase-2/ATP-dependent DNA helicase PcrA